VPGRLALVLLRFPRSAAPLPPLALRTLKRRLRRGIDWLWRQEGSPGQRARGLAAGVFMGCFPLPFLQMVLGMALASLLRGNHLLAAAGTWISNPFTSLPLYVLNYHVGSLLLGPGPDWPGADLLSHPDPLSLGWSFTSRLALGSTVVGLICAVLCSALFWRWLHRRDQLITSRAAEGPLP
jgi:uncharacterized protein (DUF2062 family)